MLSSVPPSVRTRLHAMLQPNDFLTREAVQALDERQRLAYVEKVTRSLDAVLDDADADEGRTLEYIKHYFDVYQWLFPKEFEDQVRPRFWDLTWQQAEQLRAIFADAIAKGDLSDQQKREFEENLKE